MKKLSIFLLGALGMMAASCDDAPAVATPQSNAQEPVLSTGDITSAAAGVLATNAALTLENYSADGATIPVMELVAANNLPADATVSYMVELSNTEDFARSVSLDASTVTADGYYTVDAAAWNDAHVYLFGKSPKAKTIYYRVPVYVTTNGTDYRYQSTDFYAVSGSMSETCMDAGFVIYDTYYFMSNATSWSFADAPNYAFEHSSSDVYDDPVFTIRFDLTQEQLDQNGGCWWKISFPEAVASENWDILYGPEEANDTNLVGMLVGEGNAQSGKLTEPGKYRLTINMEEMTYQFELLTRPEYVAVPNKANGWTEDGSLLYWDDGKNGFVGAAVVNPADGGFKFLVDGIWCGTSERDGYYTANGGDNIPDITETGLYWFWVNTDDQQYTITPITSLGVIGGMNSWGAQEPLTPDADYKVWSGDVNLTGEWKIRMNDNWDYNYGGDVNGMVFGGGNISGYEGLYNVSVSFAGNRPVVTLTAK